MSAAELHVTYCKIRMYLPLFSMLVDNGRGVGSIDLWWMFTASLWVNQNLKLVT